jgi:hypothetical protein
MWGALRAAECVPPPLPLVTTRRRETRPAAASAARPLPPPGAERGQGQPLLAHDRRRRRRRPGPRLAARRSVHGQPASLPSRSGLPPPPAQQVPLATAEPATSGMMLAALPCADADATGRLATCVLKKQRSPGTPLQHASVKAARPLAHSRSTTELARACDLDELHFTPRARWVLQRRSHGDVRLETTQLIDRGWAIPAIAAACMSLEKQCRRQRDVCPEISIYTYPLNATFGLPLGWSL